MSLNVALAQNFKAFTSLDLYRVSRRTVWTVLLACLFTKLTAVCIQVSISPRGSMMVNDV